MGSRPVARALPEMPRCGHAGASEAVRDLPGPGPDARFAVVECGVHLRGAARRRPVRRCAGPDSRPAGRARSAGGVDRRGVRPGRSTGGRSEADQSRPAGRRAAGAGDRLRRSARAADHRRDGRRRHHPGRRRHPARRPGATEDRGPGRCRSAARGRRRHDRQEDGQDDGAQAGEGEAGQSAPAHRRAAGPAPAPVRPDGAGPTMGRLGGARACSPSRSRPPGCRCGPWPSPPGWWQ